MIPTHKITAAVAKERLKDTNALAATIQERDALAARCAEFENKIALMLRSDAETVDLQEKIVFDLRQRVDELETGPDATKSPESLAKDHDAIDARFARFVNQTNELLLAKDARISELEADQKRLDFIEAMANTHGRVSIIADKTDGLTLRETLDDARKQEGTK